uniref:Cyclic nucleotide-binding domain-containing protein n=1 Tax=Ciona intestinalis TaxID=7719 RepID=F7ABC0_CIOIN
MSQFSTVSSVLGLTTSNLTYTTEEDHSEAVEQQEHNHPYHILFIFGSCGFGAVLRILLRKWATFVGDWKWGSLMKLPYTVFLLIIGMVVAAIGVQYPEISKEIQPCLIREMDPELFLHVFLPVVIFESAYVIDHHVFWRSIGHVSLLSVPGLLMATVLTAFLSLCIPEVANIGNFEVKVYVALIFGSIISATDPVAVVALLKDLGGQKYLGTIIEGEALLNDGAAIVVFKIFLELLKSMTPYFDSLTSTIPWSTILLVVQQSLLGPLIGWLVARTGSFILQKIYNDALAEITVTLSLTYITFYVGEVLQCKTSGVLAVVTLGLALDRASITPQVDHFLHRFWEMLAYLANTLIFVIVGIIIINHMEEITFLDVGHLLILYIGTTIIRAVSIFCFFPAMQRLGIDLNWRHVLVMTWGGLRGAVGLTLAIYLNSYIGNYLIFQKILMHTGGIVFLTLFINASTIEAVLKKLGMLDITNAQQVSMLNAVNRIQNDLKRSVGVLKYDRFLADAKWSMVEEMTMVEYPYKDLPTNNNAKSDALKMMERKRSSCSIKGFKFYVINSAMDSTYKDLLEEARLRMITALKMSYGKQYSTGMLTDQEARVLIAAADTAADKPGEFINISVIRKSWEVTGILPHIKGKLEDWMYSRKTNSLVPPRNRQLRKIFRLVTGAKFEIMMQCIIIINIVPIVLDFMVDETWENVDSWWLALQVNKSKQSFHSNIKPLVSLTNGVFILIYCAEVGLKLAGLGNKQYIKSRWNQFDVLILIICFVELIIDFVLVSGGNTGNLVKTVNKVTKTIRMLRATRLLRLSKTIMPRMVDFINKLINKKLSFGYNVGKGFITAEEEVNKLIVSISENSKIQAKLMEASDKNRLEVTREMGLLQRDHPGIAISVKTKNAVSTILNHSRDAIHQLCAGGVLDENEMQLLERGIEIKLKRQTDFPSTVAPPPPEDLLENVFWIKDNNDLLDYVKLNAVCMDYDYGDIIMQEDDLVDGIHIIVYGMIKLYGSLHGHIQHLRLGSENHKPIEIGSRKGEEEEDFLGSGNIIGEIGLLTKCNRTCTITCETAVQTYFISTEDMEKAFIQFPDLKQTMWKVVAIRISAPLFLENLEYQGFGLEQIHLHLSMGYIKEITPANPLIHFTDSIVEIALIHGSMKPIGTEEINAPFLF